MKEYFLITEKTKKKARRRRIRGEKKWFPLRIVGDIALPVSIVLFVAGIFVIPYDDETANLACSALSSVLLMTGVTCKALIANVSSHWIQDRLNESIWVEGDMLNQFIQTSFAAGMNARTPDIKKEYLFAMDMNTIRNAKYDPASGRIVFVCDGVATIFSDIFNNKIEDRWNMQAHDGIFYDYTEPSLYEFLKSRGVQFEETTLDFKVRDGRI